MRHAESLAAALALLAAVGACQAAGRARAARERAVYAAVLDHEFSGPGRRQLVLTPVQFDARPALQLAALAGRSAEEAVQHGLIALHVPLDAAADLRRASAHLDTLPLPIPARLPVAFDTLPPLTRAQHDSLVRQLRPGAWLHAGFERYQQAYPGATAVVRFSPVGFSPDGREALVYAGFYCGELCGGMLLFRLEQAGGTWRVVNTIPFGAS